MDRWPYPFIEMPPGDMAELDIGEGDLVEVWNETFMLFGYPTGVQGNVVNTGTNELMIPNYKQTWSNIRRLPEKPRAVAHVSFKSREYRAG